MPEVWRRPILTAFAALACLAAACDNATPVRPTTTTTTTTPPPPGPAVPLRPTVTKLTIAGPASLPPGETTTFTATATWSDGSTRDVTADAEWTTTNGSVLSVRDDGIVEALTLGEGDVLASFEKLSSGRVLIAVPTGRFKLSVDVHDGVIPAQSVVDARVEVLSGARDVRAVTNSWSSITRLYGVPRDVDIRVSKDGYTSVTQRLRLDRLSTLVHVSLVPSIDRPTLTGLYRMTVASAACADGSELPDVARTREYEAHVWEPGGKVSVRLDGADLVPKVCASGGCFGGDGLSFHGVVQALDAVLTLAAYDPGWDWDDWLYPSVVERLPDGVLLSFSGLALLRPTRDGFDGTLDGSIDLFRTSSLAASGVTPSASCRSSRHRLTFRR